MLKRLVKFNLASLCLFPVFLSACNGGSSSANSNNLLISQSIPNLYLDQNWEVRVSSSGRVTESIEVTLQSPYGILTSPSTVVLTPESPIASFSISGNVVCVACKISASSNNYGTAYSNNFDVKSGQLPDYGGLADLEVATGSHKIFAASTNGHVYRAQIESSSGTSGPWIQMSTEIPDSSSILDMDYDRLTQNLYAITANGNAYLSILGVGSWKQLGGGSLPDNSISFGSQIDTAGNLFVAANNGNIYATSLNGGNWQIVGNAKLPDGGVVTTEYGIYIVPINNNAESIFVGSSLGNVYVSNINPASLVSGSWVHIANSSIPDEITSISVDSSTNPESGSIYAGTNRGLIYYSSGINGAWKQLGAALGGSIDFIVIDSSTSDIYALTQYGAATFSAYYSLASGFTSWTNFGNILPESMSDGCTVSDVVTSFPGTNLQFAGTNCGNVYFSTYGFTDWKAVGLSL
ncbi:MAG: hypothetical protein E6Q33_01250 [Neisseriales bacterium]|nr:MAG: hypothetical protein E6Q33_01250 [Neisseriales bacterium]